MALQKRLDAIRRGFEAQAGDATVAVMHAATDALAASGQAERASGEGDVAPPFELESTAGTMVSLADLREKGPVVVTFFRGHW